MTITQERLIRDIAEQEDIPAALVRRTLLSLEEVLFRYLSSTTSETPITVKPFSGLSVECRYIPPRRIHTYKEILCEERIWAKPKITRYYNRKLNET